MVLLGLLALKQTSMRSIAVEAEVPPPIQKLSVAEASIMCSRDPQKGSLPHLTHARGCHGDPRNNHLGDAYGRSSLRAEKSKLLGMTLSHIHGWARVRVTAKSELVKGKGWTCQGLSGFSQPSPTQPASGLEMKQKGHEKCPKQRNVGGIEENERSRGDTALTTKNRTGYEREFPPPTQRETSAHPGMTKLVVIFVLHGDALDEFPRHRQEMLDLGQGCWKPASHVTHQGTKARALKL